MNSAMDIQTEMNGRLLHVQLPSYEFPPSWLPPDQRRHHPDYCNNIQLFLPRIIQLKRSKVADALGFNVRGGKDYLCGVYISKVSPGTDAERLGLQEGDQILLVNGINFEDIYHSKAVKALKSHTDIEMVVRFFPYGYNKTYDKSRALSAVHSQQRQQQIPQTVNGTAPPPTTNRPVLSPLTVPDGTGTAAPNPAQPQLVQKPQQQRLSTLRYDPSTADARVAPNTTPGPMPSPGVVGYVASPSYRQQAADARRAFSPGTVPADIHQVSPVAGFDSPHQQQQMPGLVRVAGAQYPQGPDPSGTGGLVIMSSGSATSATSGSTAPAFAATRSIQRVVASGGPSFQQQQPRPASYYGPGRSENTHPYTGGDLPAGGDAGGYWSGGGFGSTVPYRYSGQFTGQYP